MTGGAPLVEVRGLTVDFAGALRAVAGVGLRLDRAKNAARSDEPRAIQQAGVPLQILVLPTNEELQIALETKQIIEGK